MSEGKTILGHIDCPTCGAVKGMRITRDKNGEPFGFCEGPCAQQMRIGGKPHRVRAFVARYPWAAGKAEAAPVPAPVPEPTRYERHREIAKAPAPAPVAAAPAATRSPFADALALLGGSR